MPTTVKPDLCSSLFSNSILTSSTIFARATLRSILSLTSYCLDLVGKSLCTFALSKSISSTMKMASS